MSMSEAYRCAMFECAMSARASTYNYELISPSLTVIHLLIDHTGRDLEVEVMTVSTELDEYIS